ncbi:MAG: flagellar hook-length control protein FliK [Devosia sp.]|uniref:flagellar hook-length control protein FliK n=1 Tax=Devosia sp. TaxID=1871048 RepID=UPI0024C8D75F|nr:flagellar hook-length control protein FliK [Devosia sp.]UYO00142.1 MAG: flagellar hook-length control protein FliK [Devosia sp.]
MSISSQLPPLSLGQYGPALRALGLQAGQTVEARVVATAPNGTVQVQIGKQTLSLQMPSPPPLGSALSLSVLQTDGQLRLALVGIKPPATAALPATAPALNASIAASVQLSPAAQASTLAPPVSTSSTATPVAAAPQQGAASAAAAGPAVATAAPTGATPVPTTASTATPVQPGLSGGPASGPAVAPAPAGTAPAMAPATQAQTAATAPATAPPTTTLASAAPIGTASAPPTNQPVTGTPAQAPAGPTTNAGTPAPATTASPATGPAAGMSVPAAGAAPRAAVPYAVAAPAAGAVIAGVDRLNPTSSTALPPVQQAGPSTQVGQHAGQGSAPLPQAQPGVATSPTQTPQAALTQMAQHALPQQGSVVALTTAIAGLAATASLPEPVKKALQQVMAHRLSLDGAKMDGKALQTAIRGSGIFQEALLANGQARVASGDMKSALLNLQGKLTAWLGDQAPVQQVTQIAPPVRGQLPRARTSPMGTAELPVDPVEAGKVLLERTESALSRLRLHQQASLPDAQARHEGAQWSLDLPVSLAGQQSLLQMQIHRDAEGGEENPEDRGWQVRFAMNLAGIGEVGAQVSLRSGTAGIMLWADQKETADLLASGVEDLRDELATLGLVPGAIVVRNGAPSLPSANQPAGARHILDAMR